MEVGWRWDGGGMEVRCWKTGGKRWDGGGMEVGWRWDGGKMLKNRKLDAGKQEVRAKWLCLNYDN
jgi:hypothetical protein